MKLISLLMSPRGINGWTSGNLLFGEEITSLFALNGSGKTPLIQAIVYCLGYAVTFREDLAARCESITLSAYIKNKNVQITRWIGKEFLIEVKINLDEYSFTNEAEYSQFLFTALDLKVTDLIGLNRLATKPYISLLLPIFYLDQDHGYGSIYKPQASFIKDQFCEMVRFIFSLSPKNSFESKKRAMQLKEEVDSADRKIVALQKVVSDLSEQMVSKDKSDQTFQEEISIRKSELSELRSNNNVQNKVRSIVDDLISKKEIEIKSIDSEILDLNTRIDGIGLIKNEIETELDTLGLNEESKRIFESFNEICGNAECGLFIGSSVSYAKNLLYLKDQIKDLERNSANAALRVGELSRSNIAKRQEILELVKQQETSTEPGDISGLIDIIGRLTQEIFDLEKERKLAEILNRQKTLYFEKLNLRDRLQDEIGQLGTTKQTDLAFLKLRQNLKVLVVKWLDILKITNVSMNIEIDAELKFTFNGEPFDAIKGSTKTRLILGIHAALFELYLEDDGRAFRFLILDTPKQQELHTTDLSAYIAELKKLAHSRKAQILFSSTDYQYPIQEHDVEWLPQYSGPTKKMYLGPLESS